MRAAAIVGGLIVAVVVVFVFLRGGSEPVEEVAPPELRIVSIAPSVTETLFALGLGEFVVGRTSQCDFPPEVASIPSVGSGMEPDVEQIIAARPTVLVASAMQADYPVIEAVGRSGVEILLLSDQALHEYYRSVEAFGERFERPEEAAGIVTSLRAAFEAVSENRASPDFLTTAFVVGTDPIYLAGAESYIDELMQRSGASNNVNGEWVRYDDEAFIAYAPQLIIQAVGDAQEPETWERFGESVPAVRDGRLCTVDADRVARIGPRLAEVIVEIAECVQRHLASNEGSSEGSAAAE